MSGTDRSRVIRGYLIGGALGATALVAVSAVVLAAVGVLNYERSTTSSLVVRHPTATVQKGIVSQRVEGQVSVAPAATWAIDVPSNVSGDPVITRPGSAAGAKIDDGDVIATVNERPVILVTSSLPFFRALGPAMHGRDVASLQAFLHRHGFKTLGDRQGYFGAATAIAVYQLYSRLGYQPESISGVGIGASEPSSTGVPMGELKAASTAPVIANSGCGTVGQAVGKEICTLHSRAQRAEISFAERDRSQVKSGDSVSVTAGGKAVTAKLGSLVGSGKQKTASSGSERGSGDSSQSGDNDSANPTVTYGLIFGKDGPPHVGSVGTGTIVVRHSNAGGLKVVSTAIRSSAGGRAWLRMKSGRTVDVKVGVCAQGFCAVSASNGKVAAGSVVVLPAVASKVQTRGSDGR